MNTAENIINKNTKNINTNDVDIVPCNTGVLLDFYEENPYRCINTLDNGLILGIESTKRYKSNETGEMEDTEEYVAVAKVIAVGPDCKNVKVGEDVCAVKHLSIPVPFRNKNLRLLNEGNIMCRFINK